MSDLSHLFFADAPSSLRIALQDVDADLDQPRQSFDKGELAALAESLKTIGLLQPVLVSRAGERYRLVAGERRVRAARLAGWQEIDARILEADCHPGLAQLAENTQRSSLTPAEMLDAVERLTNAGLSAAEIAAATGITDRTVRRYREVGRDDELAESVREGESMRSVLRTKHAVASASHAPASSAVPAASTGAAPGLVAGDQSWDGDAADGGRVSGVELTASPNGAGGDAEESQAEGRHGSMEKGETTHGPRIPQEPDPDHVTVTTVSVQADQPEPPDLDEKLEQAIAEVLVLLGCLDLSAREERVNYLRRRLDDICD